MMAEWDFGPVSYKRERTFNLFSKIEDHANDVHDYLKYLKFGYGRATDDATTEIRHGRMSREEGVRLVKDYDSNTPSTLPVYCDFLGISTDDFYRWVEPMRDAKIWNKAGNAWTPEDAVWKHETGPEEKAAAVEQVADRTFSPGNRCLYYNDKNPPEPRGELALDQPSRKFRVG